MLRGMCMCTHLCLCTWSCVCSCIYGVQRISYCFSDNFHCFETSLSLARSPAVRLHWQASEPQGSGCSSLKLWSWDCTSTPSHPAFSFKSWILEFDPGPRACDAHAFLTKSSPSLGGLSVYMRKQVEMPSGRTAIQRWKRKLEATQLQDKGSHSDATI